MQILQALILGIVQGLTEFIPVSSSGHLILVGHLLGFQYSGLGFDTALDVGTLAALLLFFKHDIWELIKGIFGKSEMSRLSWMMVAATIPAVFFGVLLQSAAETTFRSAQLVAINLIIVAFIMLGADYFGRKKLKLEDMTWGRSLAIGFAQALALVPGVSRSGITISAGLFAGFNPVAATRFSFLLSAPVIAGATAKVVLTPSNFGQLTAEPVLYLVGILSAFISGYFTIRFLLSYLSNHGISIFAYYRIVVGVIILLIGLK